MAKSPGKRSTIRPRLKESEDGRINNNWRRLFLDHLAETSNVTDSAAKAGISASRAYKVRREEPEFARLWLDALWEGYTHLEMEVVRSLRQGTWPPPTRENMTSPMPCACSPRTATPRRRPWPSSAMSASPKCPPRSIERSRKSGCGSRTSDPARTARVERRSRMAGRRRDGGRPAHRRCPRPKGEGRIPVPLAAARAPRTMRAPGRLAYLTMPAKLIQTLRSVRLLVSPPA